MILSANVGSPICSCQRETRGCDVGFVKRTVPPITDASRGRITGYPARISSFGGA